MNRLKSKNVIVTGSGNGIGASIAKLFSNEGANVVVADIEDFSGKKIVEDITNIGNKAIYRNVDTSNSESVKNLIQSSIEEIGEIDILINNAAAFVFGTVETITNDDWSKVFGVNVIGYANCVREVLPSFRENNKGVIVNIASVSSFIAQPEFVPYNSSKGAVLQLTRCLAMDLAKENIRVNAVSPGSIKTRATDIHIERLGLDHEESYREFGKDALLNRMGRPEEIAYGALFLASDESSFMTGTNMIIDGGASID
ncbi:MAG: short-chain dehydrogenase [Chloroflexi bacterium]|nr:short-chain dehydrogenase [Chloroflexota bacterium]|tara:strand:+ start:1973 stop:2740 length:768 start_codon:yes stop_codon:yes gene_type:complete